MTDPVLIYSVFIASLFYFVVLTVYYLFLVLVGSVEEAKRAFEGKRADYSTLFFSTFKMPVSIIMPARNEEVWIGDSLKALLNLNYPEFEIIVVNDGSTDRTLEVLNGILKLKPVDTVYVRHYRDGMVRQILKSELYPNVRVIDKEPGHKKAGASNAGLNIARYDHICAVDADTILEQDSFLKVMMHVARDPDRIIGIGSYFGLVNGFKVKNGVIIDRSFSYNPIVAYQNIEYIRSFIGNRLAWSKYNAMPTVAGGFGIWRKDFLYEENGFAFEFTCEDLELSFRAHEYATKNKEKGYKILMLPYYVGWTDGPNNIASLISQRSRWQRVTNETVWKYKHMLCNPKYGAFAFLTLPYFLLYEVLGVFVEILCVAFVTVGWLRGILDVRVFLAFLALMLLTQAFTSLLSILVFIQGQRIFRARYVVYMVALTLVEFLFYRWIISIAKIRGMFDYIFGRKTFDRYVRVKRA